MRMRTSPSQRLVTSNLKTSVLAASFRTDSLHRAILFGTSSPSCSMASDRRAIARAIAGNKQGESRRDCLVPTKMVIARRLALESLAISLRGVVSPKMSTGYVSSLAVV